MIFSQNIIVAHEEDWTKYDVEKALKGCQDGSDHGWNVIIHGTERIG
ncbi:ATPase [Bacillus mycoides]